MEAQDLALAREAEVHILARAVAEPVLALTEVPKEVFRAEVPSAFKADPQVRKASALFALSLVQFHYLVFLCLCVR